MNREPESSDSRMAVNQITEGVIWKQLLLFFFPILFGTFFQQLYNTADAIIVGRFVGKEALAAVGGSTGTLINLLVGFFVGLSSGATVIISQFYGAGKGDQVKKAVHTAITFSVLSGLVLMVVGILGAPFALKIMGTPDDIMGHALVYIRVYFLGIVGNLIYNIGAGILRAIGDSKKPLYFLMASCFTNIVLDVVFVVFLKMNVLGAALATILSQLVSAILVILVLTKSKDAYALNLKDLGIDKALVLRIIKIGLPAGLQSVMYNFSNIIIQSSVNALGTDTIAAWTAYSKIDSVYWMIISAFGISITTFVGQNYGARKKDRVYQGIRVCLKISYVTTIFLSIVLFFGGRYIFYLFTTDPMVLSKGMEILHFLVPTFFTYVLIEIYSGSLRGVGDCWFPMMMTCVGVCVLRVIWVCVVVPFNQTITTIVISYPLSWTLTSILFFIYFRYYSRLRKKYGIRWVLGIQLSLRLTLENYRKNRKRKTPKQ